MIDSAFFDRFHAYVPGWEIPKMRPEFFTNQYGLIVDYLAEWLREMRKRNFGDAINKHFKLGRDLCLFQLSRASQSGKESRRNGRNVAFAFPPVFQKKHTIRPLGNRKFLIWQLKSKPPARKPIFVGKHFQQTFNGIKKQGSVQVQNPGAKRLRAGLVGWHWSPCMAAGILSRPIERCAGERRGWRVGG
jgi:hypothetical protein